MKLLIPVMCLLFLFACNSVPQKNVAAAKTKVSETRSSYFSSAKTKAYTAKTKFFQSQSVVTKSDFQGIKPESLYKKNQRHKKFRNHKQSSEVYVPELQ